MAVAKVIGSNIKNLMEKNSISLRQLSDEIGITHPTLKRYVDGEQQINSELLLKIAHFFNRPFDYFFRENNYQFSFSFRADSPNSNLGQNDFDLLTDTLIDYVNIVGEPKVNFYPQEYIIKCAGNKLTTETEKLIEKIAIEQRRFLDIESVIPNNYYEVLEKTGIQIISKVFENDSFFGASSFSPDYGSFILINDSPKISEERKLFSLYHECAHLLFDRNQYQRNESNTVYLTKKSDIREKIADRFAGYFLIPREMVVEYVKEHSGRLNPIEMKHYFQISIQTLFLMLRHYGIVTTDQYQAFWKSMQNNGYMKNEYYPMEAVGLEKKNPKLIKHIRYLFDEGNISINKISKVFNISNIETRAMIKNWNVSDGPYITIN